VEVRLATAADRRWIVSLLRRRWGSTRLVTRGQVYEGDRLPALVAVRGGRRCGLATYRVDAPGQPPAGTGAGAPPESCEPASCEMVSLDAVVQGRGVGTALVQELVRLARGRGCRRLWLITTNDNLPALGFYQRRGFVLVAVHREALTLSRRLKPSIPEVGLDGIPLRDELELELELDRPGPVVAPSAAAAPAGG
jgi:GNAT superfamily N-acetyltransferase